MDARARVFYLDDDKERVDEYIQGMVDLGLEVVFFTDVDPAWTWLQAGGQRVDLIILDTMLPSSDRYSDILTEYGWKTGLLLYRDIRELLGPTVPIIILTNNNDPIVQETVRGDSQVEIVLKPKIFYDEFAEMAARKLEVRKQPTENKGQVPETN